MVFFKQIDEDVIMRTEQVINGNNKQYVHFRDGRKVQEKPGSQTVISAVTGEFYDYSTKFTEKRALFALLHCKSSKGYSVNDIVKLGVEANFIFSFNESITFRSVGATKTLDLPNDFSKDKSHINTYVSLAGITAKDFYEIRSRMQVSDMIKICQKSCSDLDSIVTITPESVVAFMTESGKYGLFLVKEVTPELVSIDACHILL